MACLRCYRDIYAFPDRLGFAILPPVPTVLRLNGLRVVIYPNDHRPPHVHVIGPDGEAVFVLGCPDGPPKLRESRGFDRHGLARVRAELAAHVADLCERWRAIHGSH